ncbi:unnamed protein product [Gadus morhua 'NCC']
MNNKPERRRRRRGGGPGPRDIRADVCSGLTLRISTKITNAPRSRSVRSGQPTSDTRLCSHCSVTTQLLMVTQRCGATLAGVSNRLLRFDRSKTSTPQRTDAHALKQVCVSGLNAEHWDPTARRDGPHSVEGRTPHLGGPPSPFVRRSPGAYITHCSGRGECALMNHFISGRTSAFRQGQSRLSGAEARPPPAGSPALGAGAVMRVMMMAGS